MNVKLGICNFCVPGVGVYAARFVAEAGLDGMSIEYGTYEQGFPLSLRKVQEAYLDDQQKYGIEYANIGCSGFDFIPFHVRENDPLHDDVMLALKKVVAAADYMKIPMIFVPGFHKSEVKSEEDLEYTAKTFRYLCEMAGEKDILVSSENQLTVAQQHQLYDMVGCDNFGMFYDSDNYFYNKEYDQVEILEGTIDILSPQLHVKDGKKGVLAGSLLGQGDANFYGTIETLKKHDYEGWLIIENLYYLQPLRDQNEDLFALFHEDVRILKNAVK
jgi:sugar phosphate isomerase/epimerase